MIRPKRAPVIMCTWKRIPRLPRTLELLAEQDEPVVLYIWNNARRQAEQVDAFLRRSPIPAQSLHCSRNIGGFGRFYLARDLAASHDAVLFVDDDEDFGRSMVADQLESFAPESLAAWWAFRYRPGARSYGERDRVERPLAPADSVGVGGLVADSSIFTDPGFFRCPRRYWFCNDLWLSYYASHVRGWRLRKSLAEFEFASDGLDIDLTLGTKKLSAFRYLRRRGWEVGVLDSRRET